MDDQISFSDSSPDNNQSETLTNVVQDIIDNLDNSLNQDSTAINQAPPPGTYQLNRQMNGAVYYSVPQPNRFYSPPSGSHYRVENQTVPNYRPPLSHGQIYEQLQPRAHANSHPQRFTHYETQIAYQYQPQTFLSWHPDLLPQQHQAPPPFNNPHRFPSVQRPNLYQCQPQSPGLPPRHQSVFLPHHRGAFPPWNPGSKFPYNLRRNGNPYENLCPDYDFRMPSAALAPPAQFRDPYQTYAPISEAATASYAEPLDLSTKSASKVAPKQTHSLKLPVVIRNEQDGNRVFPKSRHQKTSSSGKHTPNSNQISDSTGSTSSLMSKPVCKATQNTGIIVDQTDEGKTDKRKDELEPSENGKVVMRKQDAGVGKEVCIEIVNTFEHSDRDHVDVKKDKALGFSDRTGTYARAIRTETVNEDQQERNDSTIATLTDFKTLTTSAYNADVSSDVFESMVNHNKEQIMAKSSFITVLSMPTPGPSTERVVIGEDDHKDETNPLQHSAISSAASPESRSCPTTPELTMFPNKLTQPQAKLQNHDQVITKSSTPRINDKVKIKTNFLKKTEGDMETLSNIDNKMESNTKEKKASKGSKNGESSLRKSLFTKGKKQTTNTESVLNLGFSLNSDDTGNSTGSSGEVNLVDKDTRQLIMLACTETTSPTQNTSQVKRSKKAPKSLLSTFKRQLMCGSANVSVMSVVDKNSVPTCHDNDLKPKSKAQNTKVSYRKIKPKPTWKPNLVCGIGNASAVSVNATEPSMQSPKLDADKDNKEAIANAVKPKSKDQTTKGSGRKPKRFICKPSLVCGMDNSSKVVSFETIEPSMQLSKLDADNSKTETSITDSTKDQTEAVSLKLKKTASFSTTTVTSPVWILVPVSPPESQSSTVQSNESPKKVPTRAIGTSTTCLQLVSGLRVLPQTPSKALSEDESAQSTAPIDVSNDEKGQSVVTLAQGKHEDDQFTTKEIRVSQHFLHKGEDELDSPTPSSERDSSFPYFEQLLKKETPKKSATSTETVVFKLPTPTAEYLAQRKRQNSKKKKSTKSSTGNVSTDSSSSTEFTSNESFKEDALQILSNSTALARSFGKTVCKLLKNFLESELVHYTTSHYRFDFEGKVLWFLCSRCNIGILSSANDKSVTIYKTMNSRVPTDADIEDLVQTIEKWAHQVAKDLREPTTQC